MDSCISLWVIGYSKDLDSWFPSLSLKSWLNWEDSQLKHKWLMKPEEAGEMTNVLLILKPQTYNYNLTH